MPAKAATRRFPALQFTSLTFTLIAALFFAVSAKAEEEIIVSHGITIFEGDPLMYGPDFEHLDYVNPDAPKGGEISIWGFGSFDSMNPYTTSGRSGALVTMLYESLLTGTADDLNGSYGLLAESLEYPMDRSWVIFNIRPEAHFSDGSPLTADDVAFSYNLFLTQGLPEFRVNLERQVASVEVLDTHRIKFVFQEDWPKRDLPMTVGGLPVFSRAHYEANEMNLEEPTLDPFLGSGPYVLDEMDVGQTLTYARDENYWAKDLPINVGRNNFDSIRVEYFADYQTAFEGFKGGAYTFRSEASSLIWATGYDFPAIENEWVIKEELPDGTIATGQSFVFNLRREQLQDARVREAIALMFNFEWSNETLFYGLYERIDGFWENSDLAATGLPTPEELAILEPIADILPAGVLTEEPVMAPDSDTRQLDRANLRRASALLDEAGWIVGDDGLRRNEAGETLRVAILNDSQTFERVINPFVDNLRTVGIDAIHERVDQAQAIDRERPPNYDFDLVVGNFPMSYVPGSGLRQFFGSETAHTSTRNRMGLESEAVDHLIEVVLAAETQEEVTHSVRALDRVLRAERFWIPQWYKDVHTVAYYDMYEYPETLPPYARGELDFWWYNEEKAEALFEAGALSRQ